MKIRLSWHPDKYMNQLHCDGASIFHTISTKMKNFSFVADVDDYLMVSLCQDLYICKLFAVFGCRGLKCKM